MDSMIYVEVRAAEGGEDAKLLVRDLIAIYVRYATRNHLTVEIVEDRPGQMTLEIGGDRAAERFSHEAGGHRFQRIPPTEKRGRVHTSTVTTAVLAPEAGLPALLEADVEEVLFRKAAGHGGQNVNKTATAVRLLHRPSGIRVECCSERSQKQNREAARRLLAARVATAAQAAQAAGRAAERLRQVGSGMRGDKVRTYRERDDRVTDHRTGRRCTMAQAREGKLDLLLPDAALPQNGQIGAGFEAGAGVLRQSDVV
jgi:peptide chain release factor 1